MNFLLKFALLPLALLLPACTSVPTQVEPVSGFDAQRYLGTWYEIARLDHRFERGLSRVTATYSARDDGGITVLNRGFKDEDDAWRQAQGKAYFAGARDVGHLKVSFFGPFYASYVVFGIDPEYRIAYVSGYNHDNLWLLARNPQISDAEKQRFVEAARARGFDVDGLIWVEQSAP